MAQTGGFYDSLKGALLSLVLPVGLLLWVGWVFYPIGSELYKHSLDPASFIQSALSLEDTSEKLRDINKDFILIIFGIFVVGVLTLIFDWAKRSLSRFGLDKDSDHYEQLKNFCNFLTHNTKNIPYAGILMSFGILGTFVGIYFGLQGFNPDDPNKSVKELLEGLKIAFATSVVGLGFSVFYQLLEAIFAETPEQETASIVAEGVNKQFSKIADTLQEEIRSQLGDSFKDLKESIKALNDWMKHFNVWMEKLRDILEGLIKDYEGLKDELAKQIEAQREHLKLIEESYEKALEKISALLGEQMNVFRKETERLIKEMRQDYEGLKDELAKQAEAQREHLKLIEESYEKAFEKMRALQNELEGTNDKIKEIPDSLAPLTEQIGSIKGLIDAMRYQTEGLEEFLKQIRGLGDDAKASLGDINTSLTNTAKHFEKLKTSFDDMPDKLKKSLDEFVGVLGNISKKFADDYTPLAEKLNQVLVALDAIDLATLKALADKNKTPDIHQQEDNENKPNDSQNE